MYVASEWRPSLKLEEAIMYAANVGRNGRGALIVVASGNGALSHDSCAFDGYAASVYTFTIGAISSIDEVPDYSEGCAALLGLAYSGGNAATRPYTAAITTTDWVIGGSGCTESFSGTSASAPLAAGIFALVLEARPCLIQRDVLWITALSSRKTSVMKSKPSSKNGVGLLHTNEHGFGIISAKRLVKAALVWPGLPWKTVFTTPVQTFYYIDDPFRNSFTSDRSLTIRYNVSQDEVDVFHLATIEQVVLSVDLVAPFRGQVGIVLQSPAGSNSTIVPPRQADTTENKLEFNFNSLHFLGESPLGVWSLVFSLIPASQMETTTDDEESNRTRQRKGVEKIWNDLEDKLGFKNEDVESGDNTKAMLNSWRLSFHGCSLTSEEVAKRIKLVEEAMFLDIDVLKNRSANVTCSQRLIDFGHNEDIIPVYLLQTLFLAQFFIGIMGIWIVLEDLVVPMLCAKENIDNEINESETTCIQMKRCGWSQDEETYPLLPHISPPPATQNSGSGSCGNFRNSLKAHCVKFSSCVCGDGCLRREQCEQTNSREELLPLNQKNNQDG